ncbi:hypothetical protein CAP48_09225 [Advenella sp. S44]|nr:hypothetical protein CAP48_09225 [Advenella sp. S44]
MVENFWGHFKIFWAIENNEIREAIFNLEVDMRKILVVLLVAIGALTGCVGYAGDGYGRYSDRYDGYGSRSGYYGSGYSGYRNVDYRRNDRRKEARKHAARERKRNDWRNRRDHDRNNWNNRRAPSRSSYTRTQRGMEGANRRLEQMRNKQQR